MDMEREMVVLEEGKEGDSEKEGGKELEGLGRENTSGRDIGAGERKDWESPRLFRGWHVLRGIGCFVVCMLCG
jgi:hypothetical protein